MKTIIYLLFFICSQATAQQYFYMGPVVELQHEKDSMCIERGHVHSGIAFITDMYCEPYIIETDSTTIIVCPSCNIITFRCARCGKEISEAEPEIRKTIWKREEKKS